jgi:hypothetical protein
MPGVQIDVDHHHGKDPRRHQLLALRYLRRGVERVAPPRHENGQPVMAMTDDELVRKLEELVEALDRRMPHRIEQPGDAGVAREAATLRERATNRLAELSDQGDAAPRP